MEIAFKGANGGDSLMSCEIEFQTVGVADLKPLRPTSLVVRGTCERLSEEEQRRLDGMLTLSLPVPLRHYTLPYWSTPPVLIFTTRAYARAVLEVVILSVCLLSVRPSHAWIVTNLNGALQIF